MEATGNVRSWPVACLFVILAAAFPAQAADNLVLNPGFESGNAAAQMPDNWMMAAGGTGQPPPESFQWDATVKESGERSVLLLKKPGQEQMVYWWQFIPLEKGRTYELSFAFKTSPDFTGKFAVLVHGCGLNYLRFWRADPAPEWTKGQLTFAPTESGKAYLNLENYGTGSVWFDNVSLSVMARDENNLLSNPGFEAEGADWKTDVGGGKTVPPGTFKWDDQVKESGGRSIMVKRTAETRYIADWFRYVPVEKGQLYQFSISFKTTPDFAGKARVSVHGCGLNEESSWFDVPAAEWKKDVMMFTPTEDGQVCVSLINQGIGSLWLDNARLEKAVADASNLASNPGFEEREKDWKRDVGSQQAEPPGVLAIDDRVSESGKCSARIIRPADMKLFADWFRYIPITKGQYKLSVSWKTDANYNGKARMFAHNCGVNEASCWFEAPSTDWKRGEVKFTATEDGNLLIALVSNGVGTIWFDNVKLEKVTPQ